MDVEPLKSGASIVSRLKALKSLLALPLKALEKPGPADDLKAAYRHRKQATVNRLLGELRHAINWGIGRKLLDKTPSHRRGVRIRRRGEEQRQRRVPPAEEAKLLAAAEMMTTAEHRFVGPQMRDRIFLQQLFPCSGSPIGHNQPMPWAERLFRTAPAMADSGRSVTRRSGDPVDASAEESGR